MFKNRRQLLRSLSLIGSISVVSQWQKPVVKSVILPSHAITSTAVNVPGTVQVFDASIGNGFQTEFTTGDPIQIPAGTEINLLITSTPNSTLQYTNFLDGTQTGNSTPIMFNGSGQAALNGTLSNVMGAKEGFVFTFQSIPPGSFDPDNDPFFDAVSPPEVPVTLKVITW